MCHSRDYQFVTFVKLLLKLSFFSNRSWKIGYDKGMSINDVTAIGDKSDITSYIGVTMGGGRRV